jgi:hypothetical protein
MGTTVRMASHELISKTSPAFVKKYFFWGGTDDSIGRDENVYNLYEKVGTEYMA